MTLVPVTVTNLNGRNVTGLERENFRLLDGKEPRSIASFSREDQPVSVGLIFDCSRSMMDKFLVAREAPAQLYNQLNDSDESFLITIADSPKLRTGITSASGELPDALLFTNTAGNTVLLDGVYLGLAELKAHNPRRADCGLRWGDNNSGYTLRDLKKIAMESDTQIFSIGLRDAPRTPEETQGPELLEQLVRASGGIHFAVERAGDIAEPMAKIGATLHNQYVLGTILPRTHRAENTGRSRCN